MAINPAYAGGSRQAMVVIRDGEEWYEEWAVEDMPSGQWYRNSKVSVPLSEARLRAEYASSLPRYQDSEIPSDFFMAQGEITNQMYPDFDMRNGHPSIVVTRKTNYFKVRRFAREMDAWYIMKGVRGLLAQLPGDEMSRFYSWEDLSAALKSLPAL